MLVRPGTCTQCGAQYHLPSDFAAPFVRCRLCPGAVRVDAPTEVAEPEPDVPTDAVPSGDEDAVAGGRIETDPQGDGDAAKAAASDEVEVASKTAATGSTEATPDELPEEDELEKVEETFEQAAGHLAYDAVQSAHDALEEFEDDVDEMVDAASHASSESFGMDARHSDANNELLHDIEEVERDIDDLEAELEAEKRDRDEPEPAASDAPAEPAPMPTRQVTGWSPAALERAGDEEPSKADLEEVAPSRPGGDTLAKLKARRAAQAAADDEKPLSTLARLKAQRAADRAREQSPTAVEPKSVSTLERLKAERAASSRSAQESDGAADGDRADAGASRRTGSRRSEGAAGRGRPSRGRPSGRRGARKGRDDDDSERGGRRRPVLSREERKKKQMTMGLVGMGGLLVAAGVLLWGMQAGWFTSTTADATAENGGDAASTSSDGLGTTLRPSTGLDPFAGFEPAFDTEGAAGDGSAEEAAAGDGGTDDAPANELEESARESGKTLEEQARERLENEENGENEEGADG